MQRSLRPPRRVASWAAVLAFASALAPVTRTWAADPPPQSADAPWIRRWAPQRNTAEIGGFAGIIAPSKQLELFDSRDDRIDDGWKPLRKVAPAIGGRAAFLPSRFVGVELEGGVMPTKTADGQGAALWTVRGHLLAQLGLWSVTPFVLLGTGAFGVQSKAGAVGKDVDWAFHAGAGVKVYATRRVVLRLDVRDVISNARGIKGLTSSVEALLGVGVVLGRREPKPRDRDHDGFLDPDDRCPSRAGIAPDGCPPQPVAVVVAIPDSDRDGLLDPDDGCPDVPETVNGYLDLDGCADELPVEVQRFSGVVEGIFFETDSDEITPTSRPTLDAAVDVLQRFPELRIRVVGHTDDIGDPAHNLDLSRRRAESVAAYLVTHGVTDTRIETRGAGSQEPRVANTDERSRARNRRIEFQVLQ